MNTTKTIIKNLLQVLIALILGCITSFIYLMIIQKYCITIFEAVTGYSDPKLNNYYSQIAKIHKVFPTIIFTILSIVIFKILNKKYKTFVVVYLLMTIVVCLLTLIFVKTNISRGI